MTLMPEKQKRTARVVVASYLKYFGGTFGALADGSLNVRENIMLHSHAKSHYDEWSNLLL
jgi:hypothetical protein